MGKVDLPHTLVTVAGCNALAWYNTQGEYQMLPVSGRAAAADFVSTWLSNYLNMNGSMTRAAVAGMIHALAAYLYPLYGDSSSMIMEAVQGAGIHALADFTVGKMHGSTMVASVVPSVAPRTRTVVSM